MAITTNTNNISAASAIENGKKLPINESSKVIRKCTVCGKEGKLVVSYSWAYPDGSKYTYDMRCYQHLRRFDKPAASHKQDRNAPCSCGSGKKFKKCCMGKESLNDKG